jgi:hypothetical protein
MVMFRRRILRLSPTGTVSYATGNSVSILEQTLKDRDKNENENECDFCFIKGGNLTCCHLIKCANSYTATCPPLATMVFLMTEADGKDPFQMVRKI